MGAGRAGASAGGAGAGSASADLPVKPTPPAKSKSRMAPTMSAAAKEPTTQEMMDTEAKDLGSTFAAQAPKQSRRKRSAPPATSPGRLENSVSINSLIRQVHSGTSSPSKRAQPTAEAPNDWPTLVTLLSSMSDSFCAVDADGEERRRVGGIMIKLVDGLMPTETAVSSEVRRLKGSSKDGNTRRYQYMMEQFARKATLGTAAGAMSGGSALLMNATSCTTDVWASYSAATSMCEHPAARRACMNPGDRRPR